MLTFHFAFVILLLFLRAITAPTGPMPADLNTDDAIESRASMIQRDSSCELLATNAYNNFNRVKSECKKLPWEVLFEPKCYNWDNRSIAAKTRRGRGPRSAITGGLLEEWVAVGRRRRRRRGSGCFK